MVARSAPLWMHVAAMMRSATPTPRWLRRNGARGLPRCGSRSRRPRPSEASATAVRLGRARLIGRLEAPRPWSPRSTTEPRRAPSATERLGHRRAANRSAPTCPRRLASRCPALVEPNGPLSILGTNSLDVLRTAREARSNTCGCGDGCAHPSDRRRGRGRLAGQKRVDRVSDERRLRGSGRTRPSAEKRVLLLAEVDLRSPHDVCSVHRRGEPSTRSSCAGGGPDTQGPPRNDSRGGGVNHQPRDGRTGAGGLVPTQDDRVEVDLARPGDRAELVDPD
ncbi:hypothetical protein BH20ACT16_BH20ACT16_01910 [soil metagenome]